MKTVLVGINSKYIHPNLAIRYLKANCDFPVDIKEFTIKDSKEYIYNNIIEAKPDILGFSVYIWNVEIIKSLLFRLKSEASEIKIVLGGPEVSYDSDEMFNDYSIDYIIANEGEIAFNQLLHALNDHTNLDHIANLRYVKDGAVIKNLSKEITDLNRLNNPYAIDMQDYKNKISYLELSRGCPYHCSYCLASLEKNVRFFDVSRVKEDILWLYNQGARIFKFLDRTFNIREDLAMNLLTFIFDNEFKDAIFQFEINADLLSETFIDNLNRRCPPNKIRFEIGIQSVNPIVNLAVERKQNTEKLIYNILKLKQGHVVMHLDLIAGLPFETLDSFKHTFDTIFRLYGEELQLGFLKILKGTKLSKTQGKYGYDVFETAPYEIKRNDVLSSEDMQIIHSVEEMLNIYWNKNFMNRAMIDITRKLESPFEFFWQLSNQFKLDEIDPHRYQLYEIFETLERFVKKKSEIDLIRYDYLSYHKIKPKIYWQQRIKKNEILRVFRERNPKYKIDDLYKYGVVIRFKRGYLLTIYDPYEKEMIEIKVK